MALPVPSIVSWPQQPMVRILLLFFAGILITEFYARAYAGVQIACCWVTITLVFSRLTKRRKLSGSRTILNGIFISVLVFLSGSICATLRNPVSWNDHYSLPFQKTNQTFLIRILPEPALKNGALKFNSEIIAVNESGRIKRTSGGLRVIVKQPGITPLKTGDQVWVYGVPGVSDEAFLPGTFDMRKWMAREGVEQLMTITGANLKANDKQSLNLRRLAIVWRKSLIAKLSDNGLKGNELAVASALILGERSEIDRETLTDYSSSGIVHILAVSGLHVGLIYAGLLLILGRWRKLKNSWTGALICLSALWLYAMMTGLSASVLRAAVMYSFIAISSVRKVSLSPFNALSASAFILLVFNPWIFKNTGFQLSYAAVWGIISFQKTLSTLFTPSRKLFRYLQESISISVAAQATTSPLTFFVFGSFPSYFLAANLIAIPFSTLLTYAGIAAIIFADVPFLGEFLAACLGLGIRFLNGIAEVVSSLPGASATNLFISFTGMLFSTMFLLQLSLLLQHFTVRRMAVGFTFLLLLAGESVYRKVESDQKNDIVLFCKNGNLNLLLIKDGQARHYIAGNYPVSTQVEADIHLFLRSTYGIKNLSGRVTASSGKWSAPHIFKVNGIQLLIVDDHVWLNANRRPEQHRSKQDHLNLMLISRKCTEADKEFVVKTCPDLILLTPFLKKAEHQAWKDIASLSHIKFLDFPFKGRLHVSFSQ